MSAVHDWAVVGRKALRYFLYRLGAGSRPYLLDSYPELVSVVGTVLKWPSRVRIRGAEGFPNAGPVVIAGNHLKGDDPFVGFYGAWKASDGKVPIRFLMRKGIFSGAPKLPLVDFDELTEMLGAIQIDRENPTLSQLRPFIRLLTEGGAFVMYPGATRSRSGAIMEMPPGQEQPGSVSFFIAHAQRRNPEAQVTAISLTRGYNPVDKSTTLTFGEPMTLDVDAPRTQQRELDRALVRQIGLGVEVNAAQATSAILYERCVRGQLEPAPIDDLQTAVFGVLSALGPDRCEPEALENPARATARTLRWLAKKDMLELRKGRVRPNREAILSQPPLDRTYKRLNPVKYLTNQILHLDEAVCEIRRQALEGLNASR